MIDRNRFIHDCRALRSSSPLVLNITNYVAMNFSANALLAVGASPIMSFFPQEIGQLVSRCDSLVINIGCLDSVQTEAMRLAVSAAGRYSKPWVLDPVGAGATDIRTSTALELIGITPPTVIRGNASEILSLLGGVAAGTRGVDSTLDSSAAEQAARQLASSTGSVISISGETDRIVTPETVETISNGSPLMSGVTAMGCVASALTAAFCAVTDAFQAAVDAMAMMGIAGEAAAERSEGTASLALHFIDILSTFDSVRASKAINQ